MNLDQLIEEVGTCKVCQQKLLYNLVPTSYSINADNISLFNKKIKRINNNKRWDFHFVAKCPYECSGFSTFPAEDLIKEWFVKSNNFMIISKRSKKIDRVELINGKNRYIFSSDLLGHSNIYNKTDRSQPKSFGGLNWNHIKTLNFIDWKDVPTNFEILAESLLII